MFFTHILVTTETKPGEDIGYGYLLLNTFWF